MGNDSSALGQDIGYKIQEHRLLYYLLTSKKGSTVAYEYAGDISVKDMNNNTLSEEVKNSLIKNPISNKSTNLWKTFYNWVQMILDDKLDAEKTTFVLYTPQKSNKTINNDIVHKMDSAENNSEVEAIIDFIFEKLYISGKWDSGEKNNIYLPFVFSDHLDITKKIIPRFKFIHNKPDIFEEINELIKDSYIDERFIRNIRLHIEGWIREEVIMQSIRNNFVLIKKDDLTNEIIKYYLSIKDMQILSKCPDDINDSEVESELRNMNCYIKQLLAIEQDINELMNAATDFLKAGNDRAFWIEQGMVFSEGLESYENTLITHHKYLYSEINLTQKSLSTLEKGQLIYSKSMRMSEKLEGKTTTEYFNRGTYHKLADKVAIKWNKDFECNE